MAETALRKVIRELKQKGPTFWLSVFVLTGIGTWAGHVFSDSPFGVQIRYRAFQLLESTNARTAYVGQTAVVLIDDEAFWRGDLDRRLPLNRRYLERTIQAIASFRPAAIVIDLNLRSSRPPELSSEYPAYQAETEVLIKTIQSVATTIPVVLPRSIGMRSDGSYVVERDVYDDYLAVDGKDGIAHGYIALPYDLRRIPMRLHVGETSVPSLALSTVEVFKPAALDGIPTTGSLPYGSYLSTAKFPTFSAGEILGAVDGSTEVAVSIRKTLPHRVVLIGGRWHADGYGRGKLVDTHLTPIGIISGVHIHANHIEALLDRRTYGAVGTVAATALEVFAVLLSAVLFALDRSLVWKLTRLAVIGVCLIAVGYVLVRNVGLILDVSIPLVLVAAHSLFDQVRDWRAAALKLEAHERSHPHGELHDVSRASMMLVCLIAMMSFGSAACGPDRREAPRVPEVQHAPAAMHSLHAGGGRAPSAAPSDTARFDVASSAGDQHPVDPDTTAGAPGKNGATKPWAGHVSIGVLGCDLGETTDEGRPMQCVFKSHARAVRYGGHIVLASDAAGAERIRTITFDVRSSATGAALDHLDLAGQWHGFSRSMLADLDPARSKVTRTEAGSVSGADNAAFGSGRIGVVSSGMVGNLSGTATEALLSGSNRQVILVPTEESAVAARAVKSLVLRPDA